MVPDYFIQEFSQNDDEDKNLLCEFYYHNLVMSGFENWDPNPYVINI
jgi:hypothetical protein